MLNLHLANMNKEIEKEGLMKVRQKKLKRLSLKMQRWGQIFTGCCPNSKNAKNST